MKYRVKKKQKNGLTSILKTYQLTKFLTKYNTPNPGTMQSLVENSKVINTCLTKKRKTKEGGKAEQKPTQKIPGLLGFNAVTALETYILYNVGTST